MNESQKYEVAHDTFADSLVGATEYGTVIATQIEIAWELKQLVSVLKSIVDDEYVRDMLRRKEDI